MKKKKYLPLYYEWMKTGTMPSAGLCEIFYDFAEDYEDCFFSLMKPTQSDYDQLFDENLPRIYWGLGEPIGSTKAFTPLRQNIVLFMAAMNGEL
jgi:hypothetical protein